MHAKLKCSKYIQCYSYMNARAIIAFLFIYLIMGILSCWDERISWCEAMFGMLKGFSFQAFNMTEFLYYIVFFMFPLFLINAFWEKEKANKNEIAMFRIGSKRYWKEQVNKAGVVCILRFYLCYIVMLVIGMVVLFCVCKGNNSEYIKEIVDFFEVSNEQLYYVVIGSVLLKGVELVLLYEISLLLYRFTKQTICSFLGALFVYMIGFVDIFDSFRIGKSSVYQLLEDMQGKENIQIVWGITIQIGILVMLLIINHMGGKCYGNRN